MASRFQVVATTQAQEDAYDVTQARAGLIDRPTGFIGTIANLVKGACGAGVLGTHVAYLKGGATFSAIGNIFIGIYITYCYWILAYSSTTLQKRTNIPLMSYSDVGEAAFAIFYKPKIQKFAKSFRYTIDVLVIVDLFGSCVAYQLIIAKTIKQIAEGTQAPTMEPAAPGWPSLRIYLLILMLPCIAICLVRHLQWLGHLSIVANITIVICIAVTIYYCFQYNPRFEKMVHMQSFAESFEYAGMIVFSMSCIGVILPCENNMKEPKYYVYALFIAMTVTVAMIFTSGFFGYAAFLDKSDSPITINYPLEIVPLILKILMAFMIFVTHALNFWVPFSLSFYYIEKRIKNKDHVIRYEYIWRALFCCMCTSIAILFPNISSIMGFLGCFCLANLIFVIPNMIYLLVIWERPGLGVYKWRLLQWTLVTAFGLTLSAAGSYVNGRELVISAVDALSGTKGKETTTTLKPAA